jgi:hypothetical protein
MSEGKLSPLLSLLFRFGNENNSKIILHFARFALPLTFGRKYSRSKEKRKMCFYFVLCSLIRTFAEKFWNMEQSIRISPAQYELLNILSCINKDEDLVELKTVIVQFLNTRLQKEIDKLWDNSTLTEEKVAAWEHEHMRTPYK